MAVDATVTMTAGPRFLLGLVLLAGILLSPVAEAADVQTMDARLPTRSQEMSAVWDPRDRPAAGCPGGCVYLFGGFSSEGSGVYDRILQYNPSKDQLTTLAARLPTPRYAASAVWDGRYAYLFGGVPLSGIGELSEIVRFDPETGAAELMPALLPIPLGRTSAIWTGQAAYVFGGTSPVGAVDGPASGNSDRIVRYDPGPGGASLVDAKLPSARGGTAAVWLGSHAVVVGGVPSPGPAQEILRFNPLSGVATRLEARLDTARGFASAVNDGRNVFVFGGSTNYADPKASIIRYDPESGLVELVGDLPSPAHASTAIWTGSAAFVFGGWPGGRSDLDTIVRFIPSGLYGDAANSTTPKGLANETKTNPHKQNTTNTTGNGQTGQDVDDSRRSPFPGFASGTLMVVLIATAFRFWRNR